MLEQLQNKKGFLQAVNPLLKLFLMLAVIFSMLAILDPWTPLVVYGVTLLLLVFLGKVPLKTMLLTSLPFFLFGLSFIWIYSVFPDERGETVLFYLFSMPIALENVMHGVSLGLRSVVFGTWSLFFVFTTEPTSLLLSMVQQAKLPPKFGYGMMAAYRLLPSFKEELAQLRLAHRLRGVTEKKSLLGAIEQTKRYSIPLLASAIRKASRTATAMESKGFTGSTERSYYRTIRWSWRDGAFLLLFLLCYGLIFIMREQLFI